MTAPHTRRRVVLYQTQAIRFYGPWQVSATWGTIMEFLRKVPLLSEVMRADADVEKVAALLSVREYTLGETIVPAQGCGKAF